MVGTPQGLDGTHAQARWIARTRRWPHALRERLLGLLADPDARAASQGWAELSVLAMLADAGWTPEAPASAGRITVAPPAGPSLLLRVLAFQLDWDPCAEAAAREDLRRAVNARCAGVRLALQLRRLNPCRLDAAALAEELGRWCASGAAGRFTWEGPAGELEASRLGVPAPGQEPVVAIDGPWHTHRAVGALEPRLVQEALRHAGSPEGQTPLLLACVAQPGWPLDAGQRSAWLRDLLYGRAARMSLEQGRMRWCVAGDAHPSLFRDPALRSTAGVIFADRAGLGELLARAHLNPWSPAGLTPGVLPAHVPVFAEDPSMREASPRDTRTLRWYEGAEAEREA